jgi:redox-sensitive bicupin YhaK (pirin superfamily)
MRKTLYQANERGFVNHGWLKSYHSFSFANYYDEDRMGFGRLRVLNDDLVEPAMGFGTHPHDNMEIISIPLEGIMAHKDSQGNEHTLKPGDIQVMSAGSGLTHSEFNYSKENQLSFLQLWIFPNVYNITPNYCQKSFDLSQDDLILIVSPDQSENSLPIQQNAFIHLGKIQKGITRKYIRRSEFNGIFVFVIEGKVSIEGEYLHKRDAIGIENTDSIEIYTEEHSYLLLIDVQMTE